MFERVALILALLMTSAAADNYRSFRTAYASVDWLELDYIHRAVSEAHLGHRSAVRLH